MSFIFRKTSSLTNYDTDTETEYELLAITVVANYDNDTETDIELLAITVVANYDNDNETGTEQAITVVESKP